MAFDDPVNHGEPEPRTEFSLRRKEWFQATLPDAFAHARAGIADVDDCITSIDFGLECDPTALGHCINGVENQIGENLTQSGFLTGNKRSRFDLDSDFNS